MRCACWKLLEAVGTYSRSTPSSTVIRTESKDLSPTGFGFSFERLGETNKKTHKKKTAESEVDPMDCTTDSTRNYEKFQALRSRPRGAAASEAAPTVAPSAARMAELVASLKAHAEAPTVGISEVFQLCFTAASYHFLHQFISFPMVSQQKLQDVAGCCRFRSIMK